VLLTEAIAQSCDIYFYAAGALTTPQVIAAEARRFHLDRRTGIELPGEAGRMLIPDPAWKQRERGVNWYPGDTANMAIGQGDVLVSPLQMACFVASVARGEVFTQPTLLHHDNAAPQKTEPIGLTLEQRTALLDGMEGSTTRGSAKVLALPELKIPGLRIAGKTGTAQVPGRKNVAWFICFAPIEQPEIAIAVAVEGDIPGENFGGGRYAAPIANSVLKKWWEKKQRGGALVSPKVLPPHP
jgi:penicillin-binding protein 2